MADARGVASFDLLRGRAREAQAFLWTFDLLELDGKDLRDLPLERRYDLRRAMAFDWLRHVDTPSERKM